MLLDAIYLATALKYMGNGSLKDLSVANSKEMKSRTLKARGWRVEESERRNEAKDMRVGVNKTEIK